MKISNSPESSTNIFRYMQLERSMSKHDERIKRAQATLKTQTFHSQKSSGYIKKQPLSEFNRIVTIDLQNKALLKKLTTNTSSLTFKQQPRRLVKNNRRHFYESHRKQKQNLGLLKRIREVKSSYQTTRFANERKQNEEYINTISKFGYKDLVPNKTIILPFAARNKALTKVSSSLNKKIGISTVPITKPVQEPESLLKIQRRKWQSDQVKAEISYLFWSQRIGIQINLGCQEQMTLQIQRSLFEKCFGNKIKLLHKSIKFGSSTKCFFLDLS